MAIRHSEFLGHGIVNAGESRQIQPYVWDLLTSKLLKVGGVRGLKPNCEPHLVALIEGGQVFTGKRVQSPGNPQQCHTNSGKLFLKSEGRLRLCTGYALTEEGLWLQHSWCATPPNAKRPWIFETTCYWDKYFGIMLDENKAVQFACSAIQAEEDLDEFFRRHQGLRKFMKKVFRGWRREREAVGMNDEE